MNLHQAKIADPQGSVDRCHVRHMLTHQGQWTARILRSRNEAEGDPFGQPWPMPSSVWHSLVTNQDNPRYHLQFKETFIQV